MENTAINNWQAASEESEPDYDGECEIVELHSDHDIVDSRPCDFVSGIEAWARHALASNGFGDY